jgi:hypothetical protein
LDPGQYEHHDPGLNFVIVVLDTIAPKIASVKVNSTSWSQAFRDAVDADTAGAGTGVGYKIPNGPNQTQPMPWNNVNQLIVQFTEDVKGSGVGGTLVPADFTVLGVAPVNPTLFPITSVSYNPVTFRATLSFGATFPTNKYVLGVNDFTVEDGAGNNLDGEWTNNVTIGNSGNNIPGGVFQFAWNMSHGNYNLSMDGTIDLFDLSVVSGRFGTFIGQPLYSVFADGNGTGVIDLFDMSIVAGNFANTLPPGTPPGGLSFPLSAPLGSPSSSAMTAAIDAALADEDDDLDYLTDDDLVLEQDQALNEVLDEMWVN